MLSIKIQKKSLFKGVLEHFIEIYFNKMFFSRLKKHLGRFIVTPIFPVFELNKRNMRRYIREVAYMSSIRSSALYRL